MNHDFDYLKDKRILLVDDEPQLLEMIEGILREAGFVHIYEATNQTEALLLCNKTTPEIAILDVMLPDGDGFTLFSLPLKSGLIIDCQKYNSVNALINLQVFVSLNIETCRFL